MDKLHLSVIIPCFNEERNIRLGALESVAHFMTKKKYNWEAILVDDGSIDKSVSLITDFINEHKHFKLIVNKHLGKAGTVTTGMFAARGSYILFTDLDQATPINQIDLMLPWFDKGFEVVIGSRNEYRRGAPMLRLAMARGFMLLRDLILNLGIRDTQCGFKIFKKKASIDIFNHLRIYRKGKSMSGSTVTAGFDVELLFIAKRLGFKIKEVPVDWHYQETRHVNPLKDSLVGLMDLIKIRLNDIRGIYK